MSSKIPNPRWISTEGEVISCNEKLKVLRQNLEEIRQVTQDAFEDALLMGCDEKQVREVFVQLMQGLDNPYEGPEKE
ncbi:MAG TPA: hypothetical protein VJM53_05775 [Burkholderiales bacterium]|nr:hypothetical protein [Burkholderiales bacterium]